MHALFGAVEDARGYFLLMEGVLRRSGVPLALYTDRHAVFRAPAQQRAGREGATQFARAMAELGVRLIFARSPQAKGRVERAAGTLQDRLVTELRLASATTIAEAQTVLERFLPRFNARFAVAAQQPEPGLVPARPGPRPRRRPRLPAHPHRRARQHRQVPLAHAAATALTATAQLRRGARGGAGAPRRRARGAPPGRDHPCAARPAPRRRAARAPLRAGARPCAGAHRLRPRLRRGRTRPAGASCRGERDSRHRCRTAGRVKPLRPPTPRQQTRWKAIRQAQLQGLSMRATARVLGISHNTVRRYVLAGGPPGRQGAASSTG